MVPRNRTLWLKLSFTVTLSLYALQLPSVQSLDTAFFLSLFLIFYKVGLIQYPMKSGSWTTV